MKTLWMITKSTKNIGDEFQNLAALQFINHYDGLIDRSELHSYNGDYAKLILNGWYLNEPYAWPPSDRLKPLNISMHFSNYVHVYDKKAFIPFDIITKGEGLRYLHSQYIVGARDIYTYKRLQRKGIKTYFSGCLTLTLDNYKDDKREDYICLIDPSDNMLNYVKSKTNRKIFVINHSNTDYKNMNYENRIKIAEELLKIYSKAHLVITSRLHGTLPCLALGTPVILIVSKKCDIRYEGLKELTNFFLEEEIVNEKYKYDFDNPLPNPPYYKVIANNLRKVVMNYLNDQEMNCDFNKINKENLEVINEAKRNIIKFRKANKLYSYNVLQLRYKTSTVFLPIINLIKKWMYKA